MRPRPLAALALAVALGLGLAGCGEDSPKPKPVGEAPTSATPDPALGAETATSRWISALNSASRSLSGTQVRALSSPQCNSCQIIADTIDSVGKNGGYIRGGDWLRPKFTATRISNLEFRIDAVVSVPKQTVKQSRRSDVETFEGGRAVPKRFFVSKKSGAWLVTKLVQEDRL